MKRTVVPKRPCKVMGKTNLENVTVAEIRIFGMTDTGFLRYSVDDLLLASVVHSSRSTDDNF